MLTTIREQLRDVLVPHQGDSDLGCQSSAVGTPEMAVFRSLLHMLEVIVLHTDEA